MTEAKLPRTRLMLITPEIGDAKAFAPVLAETCRAADVAAVVVRLAPDNELDMLRRVRDLAAAVQASGAALILADRPELVSPAAADGAHFSAPALLQSTMPSLAPGRIAGAAGLATRHDSMAAAEAGVDYVMFGEPDANGKRPGLPALIERVAWWAEIFQTPSVAFAGSIGEVAKLAGAGADFVALGDALWLAPEGAAVAIANATQELKAREPAQ